MDVKGEKTLVLSRINQSNTKKEARKSFLIYEWGGGEGALGWEQSPKKFFRPSSLSLV